MKDVNARALETLFRITQCFKGKEDHHRRLERMLEVLSDQMGYAYPVVTLLDSQTGEVLIEAAHGLAPHFWEKVRYSKGEGIIGVILKTRRSLAIKSIGEDPRFLNRLGIYDPQWCFLGVPILDGEKAIGTLTLTLPPQERPRLDDHLKCVSIVGDLMGNVMQRLIHAERQTIEVRQEQDKLRRALKTKFGPTNIVGRSRVMKNIFETLDLLSLWDTTVLIRGESGTGKELIAKAIHYQSPRSQGPLVKLNCAALPDNLLESEIFGYEKGAFTGAVKQRLGRFDQAHGGTLFLDEIGDISLAFQAKLLRVLQEGEFERLGGEETIRVDVRIITATNVNLEKAVSQGRFREDLYYRLNVMPIFLPPLRERREDIPLLVEHFVHQVEQESGRKFEVEPDCLEIISQCDLPGNVRELENCIHRAAVSSRDGRITAEALPCTGSACMSRLIHNQSKEPSPRPVPMASSPLETPRELEEIANERDRVIAALERTGWVQAKAARLLKMTPRQIAYRIKKLKIPVTQL